MAHIDSPQRPNTTKGLDQHPLDLPPDSPFLRPEVRDSVLAASERRSAAVDAVGGSLDDWNEQNAERVAAVKDAEATRQGDAAARRLDAGTNITDPVAAVNALHKLIRSAASGTDRQRLTAAVAVLADPQQRPVSKAEGLRRLMASQASSITKVVAEAVAASLAQSKAALATETTALRGEIARLKMQAVPVSGQPLMRVRGPVPDQSRQARAAGYLAKADATTDPALRQGYLELAAEITKGN